MSERHGDVGWLDTSGPDPEVKAVTPQDFAQACELIQPGKLENTHFQIVENQGTDTLSVGDFDGDDVLYHLTRARNYYAKLSQNSGVANPAVDNKVVVRIRVNRAYNLVTHFSKAEDYNNSRYIPSNYAGLWNQEIWFDEAKVRIEQMSWYGFTVFAGHSVATQDWITLGVLAPVQLAEHLNTGLDAAKMPDVIYHEAFHYASDADGLFPMASEGNPVAEDYANYFGSSLNGKPQIAEIDEFSSRFYRHDYTNVVDITDEAPLSYNATAFGPAMFWQFRKLLGQERADQLIWNSLKFIRGTFKHTDVPPAILSAAEDDPTITSDELRAIGSLVAEHHKSYENLEKKFNPLLHPSLPSASASPEPGPSQTASASPSPAPTSVEETAKAAVQESEKSLRTALIRTGESIGYSGTALFAASNAPLSFGTDFLTAMTEGKGLISDQEDDVKTQVVGGVGGVTISYFAFHALGSAALATITPLSQFGMVVTLANSLVCLHANPKGHAERDLYCVKVAQISNSITGDSAKAGAELGRKARASLGL